MPAETTTTSIQVAVEAPFLLFHISVLLCLAAQIRNRNATFSAPFYVLYCVQSAVDIVHYIENVVFFRLFRIAVLPIWFGESPTRNYVTFTTVFLNTYQYVSHAAIAINRYRTIAATTNAESGWTGRRLVLAILVLFAISLPPAILRLTLRLGVTVDPQGYYVAISAKDSVTYTLAHFSSFLYCVVTCIMSLFLELRTIYVYRKLSTNMRRQKKAEFRLLLYALLQFVGQFLMAIYLTLGIASALTGDSTYASLAQAYHPYIVDTLSLSGPVCLVAMSKALRRKYMSFCGAQRKEVPAAFTRTNVDL